MKRTRRFDGRVHTVHAREMVDDLSYSMFWMLKHCQAEIEISHTSNGEAGIKSRNHAIISRILGLVSGYIDTALRRVKVKEPHHSLIAEQLDSGRVCMHNDSVHTIPSYVCRIGRHGERHVSNMIVACSLMPCTACVGVAVVA
jgi:hypothetical protein